MSQASVTAGPTAAIRAANYRRVQNQLVFATGDERAKAEQELDRYKQEGDKALADYEQDVTDAKDRGLWQTAQAAWQKYVSESVWDIDDTRGAR